MEAEYPFLSEELALLRHRLFHRRPTLGICLGAQLMARALDAEVRPMGHKEIGFGPLALTDEGRHSCLSALQSGTPVLHWHGDRFETPSGASHLAATAPCPRQAFEIGTHALGLQFHLEVAQAQFERWLIGHAGELASAGISPSALRSQALQHGAAMVVAANAVFNTWLDQALPEART